MNMRHKKILFMTALALSSVLGTGCYKDFKEQAAYEVDEDGYSKMTGYVDKDELKNIYIVKSDNDKHIYFCYIGFPNQVEIFSNMKITNTFSKSDYMCTLQKNILDNGYDLKARYTEDDLKSIYEDCVNDYTNVNEEDRDKNLSLNVN